MTSFNNQIKQVLILSLLIIMIFLAIRELYVFLPGLLGALTFYILSRGSYFQLIYHRKWKKGWSAGLFMLGHMLILGIIIFITVVLLGPKVSRFLDDPALMISKANAAIIEVQQKTGLTFITESSLSDSLKRLASFIPSLLNDTANLIINVIILLFMLYYMLVHGKEMEQYLNRIIPLKKSNIGMLAAETKRLVKASAIGIPLISIIQGLTATLGYFIFGVDEFILWGFITGVFAFFPVVGTMIIWVPLVIYMYADGNTWNATGLFFFSFLVTGNVDYLARITLLNKLGHVHPVVTVLGVIVGLGLFGFIGLIFGPLLVNYIILLFRIYTNEFIENKTES
ncbi:MAG: AI-2E family transporter [Chitinophagaceae bacterium]|nr:MAG: AI-2E family transporter [Chitinophagaceae bacterium]